jgi:RimJ/RimL family protein N-acetyltransferase
MGKEKNQVIARSERLYLTTMKVEHVPSFVKWFNDAEVFGHIRDMTYGTTAEEQTRWVLETNRDPHQEVFSIFYIPDDHLIGDGGFININLEDRKAEIGIVLGEKQYWNRGLGTEAVYLLCRYGFEKLQLHNIMAEHYSINEKSVHLFEKVGFKIFGTRRQSRRLGGRMIDVHYSDLLPQELIKPNDFDVD